jgi:hypothetical protein
MSKSRVKLVEGVYNVSRIFHIPKNVYLLPENENADVDKVYGSWWIKWNTLYYYDKELNIQEIGTDDDDSAIGAQMKRPGKTYTDETNGESDSESDSDDE